MLRYFENFTLIPVEFLHLLPNKIIKIGIQIPKRMGIGVRS